MKWQKNINKSAVAVSVSLIVVLVLLIGTFIFSQMRFSKENIVLPVGPADAGIAPTPDDLMKNNFVQVTKENAVQVLETLRHPSCFHQTLELVVGINYPKATRYLELWGRENLLHAEVTSPITNQVKSVISDGQIAWIWYDTDFDPVSVELSDQTSIEDLLGIPKFEFLSHLMQAEITEAGHALFEDTAQQCIYVITEADAAARETYWIDLKTGLLQSVLVEENDETAYRLRTTTMEILTQNDGAYEGRFCLPDGSAPFTESE